MFDIMQLDGFYAQVISSISQLQKKLLGFAFVDDMDLCIYRPQKVCVVKQLHQSLRKFING